MADYAKRNRSAMAELRRLGLDPGGERGAVYRLRVEQGRRRGLTARQSAGKVRDRVEKSITELRKSGKLSAPPRRLKGGTAATIGGRRTTSSTSGADLVAALKGARKNGRRVTVRMNVETTQGVRTVKLGDGPVHSADITGPAGGAITVREV